MRRKLQPLRRRSTRRRGTAAVELAVVLPLLCLLLVGAWEVGRLVQVKQLLCNAVREGGRQAATGTVSAATVQQYVVNYLTTNGIAVSTSDVTFQNLSQPGLSDPTMAGQMDRLRVSVTVNYSSFRWSMLSQITSVSSLSASADWFSMMDSPLTVNTTIPAE
jgi:Flp pilus assembly protein TadG